MKSNKETVFNFYTFCGDEATFTLSDQLNKHNLLYIFATHITWDLNLFLCIFGRGGGNEATAVTVWGVISCQGVVKALFFEGTATGEKYMKMLVTYVVSNLQNTSDNFQNLYFQHDGVPHTMLIVHDYISEVFNGKVIGWWGFIEMLLRSPDLMSTDFHLGILWNIKHTPWDLLNLRDLK